MPGSVRVLLAAGLLISAGLVAVVGDGWWGLVLLAGQATAAGAVVVRPRAAGPLAWAVLFLVPGPLAAVRHWSAHLPGACHCARLPHPPPGLISLTGLYVALDVALLALALGLTAGHRRQQVGKSTS